MKQTAESFFYNTLRPYLEDPKNSVENQYINGDYYNLYIEYERITNLKKEMLSYIMKPEFDLLSKMFKEDIEFLNLLIYGYEMIFVFMKEYLEKKDFQNIKDYNNVDLIKLQKENKDLSEEIKNKFEKEDFNKNFHEFLKIQIKE